ncbi:MAG: Csu type fimbrial protein [Gemmobacter sp.]
MGCWAGRRIPVGVCLTFGGGSASDGGVPPRRYMIGPGGGLLEYRLRRGGSSAPLYQVFVEVLVVLGHGSVTVPIDADIVGTDVTLPTGAYAAGFSGAGAAGVRMRTGVLTCDLLGTEQPAGSFAVTATLASSCQVTTGALDFGNIGANVAAHVDASATIEVRCTAGTAYRVSLGPGGGQGVTGPTTRRMRNLLFALIYGLYQDPGRSMPWGDTMGDSVTGTAAGATQVFTVFGRIFAGQQAAVGVYPDSVVVTIAY